MKANDLNRFIEAQEHEYPFVLEELRRGKKQTHWMWFIFPQHIGLGLSQISQYYGIKDSNEARQYLNHPVLGKRLIECAETVLNIENASALEIFGPIDNMKLRSSMTLFACFSGENSVFEKVLDKFFMGEKDNRTLDIINNEDL